MQRDQILATLRNHAAEIRRFGVSSLFLFGSALRNETTPYGDVDLFFDFDEAQFSLIELASLQERLSELLKAPADVMSRGSLHPRLRGSIEGSAVQVF
ncbi:MAG: nucleotidyltransferase family protein [Caulobacteraceae bacterium]